MTINLTTLRISPAKPTCWYVSSVNKILVVKIMYDLYYVIIEYYQFISDTCTSLSYVTFPFFLFFVFVLSFCIYFCTVCCCFCVRFYVWPETHTWCLIYAFIPYPHVVAHYLGVIKEMLCYVWGNVEREITSTIYRINAK